MNTDNAKSQMRKGLLEYCILSVLSGDDAYAPDIIARLKDVQMTVVEGTLYPLLMRQKNAGWLSYRWEESPQGPPRKYYSITGEGKRFLSELDIAWQELVTTVNQLRNQSNHINNKSES
ncbi:MAG: PadR family transcriptional regulator [Bacteroidales bacterium]|jgi:PadR family transcriptional regulator PadR|nr:PadR family transcriptional regulator [Bacteroidales bacterium]